MVERKNLLRCVILKITIFIRAQENILSSIGYATIIPLREKVLQAGHLTAKRRSVLVDRFILFATFAKFVK